MGIPIGSNGRDKRFACRSRRYVWKNTAREFPYFAFGFIGNIIEGGGKKQFGIQNTQLSNVIDEEYATAEDDTKLTM